MDSKPRNGPLVETDDGHHYSTRDEDKKRGRISRKGCDWHVPIGNVEISLLWLVEGAMASSLLISWMGRWNRCFFGI